MKTKIEILKKCLQDMEIDISNIVNEKIDNVSIDSREIESNDLFFAINKGNNFVKEVLGKKAIVICDDKKYKNKKIDNLIYVPNTVYFMQFFARIWRLNVKTKIVGITGSNGKTTVKDILAHFLKLNGNVLKTYKNYNNHIGVPLTLLKIKESDDFAILEMGTSNKGEIEFLSEIVQPDYSIITNIGMSHLEYFKSIKEIFIEKTKIVEYTRNKTIINGRDPYLRQCDSSKILKVNNDVIYIDDINIVSDLMEFDFVYKDFYAHTVSNIVGEHNAINLLLAITCAIEITGANNDEILKYLKIMDSFEITEMRFEIIKHGATTLINDAYNSSPISLKCALKTFDRMYPRNSKIAVIGSMLELGENSKKYHEDILTTLLNTNIETVVLYGEELEIMKENIMKYKLPIKFLFISLDEDSMRKAFSISKDEDNVWLIGDGDLNSTKRMMEIDLITSFLYDSIKEDPHIRILFKGSRGVHLEEIVQKLMKLLKKGESK